MPAPRSPAETRMSHSTATSARPPSMERPGVLTAITAPPARAPSRRAQTSPQSETSKRSGQHVGPEPSMAS